MAKEKQQIVIKKITVVAGGGHGGAWKVAFADFMTAMMAFFLVMWLLGQSEETKKNVSDYFSTPSVIEYSFSNFGVELTLEKLFLDLLNEPLKFFQDFITPMDSTPNIMSFGTKKVVLSHLAEQLGDVANNVKVDADSVEFEIPDNYLFEHYSASPAGSFVEIMNKVKSVTRGVEDSIVVLESRMKYHRDLNRAPKILEQVGEKRLDLMKYEIESTLEHNSSQVEGATKVIMVQQLPKFNESTGSLVIRIEQKEFKQDGSKTRKLEQVFGEPDENASAYDNFVKQISSRKAAEPKKEK